MAVSKDMPETQVSGTMPHKPGSVGIVQFLAKKTRTLSLFSLFSLLASNIMQAASQPSHAEITRALQDAKATAVRYDLAANYGISNTTDAKFAPIIAAADQAHDASEIIATVKDAMGEQPSVAELYQKAEQNTGLNKLLDKRAYAALIDEITPDTLKSGVQLFSPLGKTWQDVQITNDAGKRHLKKKGASRKHGAIDLHASAGTPVYAVTDGAIQFGWSKKTKAYYAKITSQEGIECGYVHIKNIKRMINPNTGKRFQQGDQVSAGDKISEVSATHDGEISTGPHLHFFAQNIGEEVDIPQLNNLKPQNGFFGRVKMVFSDAARKIGLSTIRQLVNGKTIPQIRTQIAKEDSPRKIVGEVVTAAEGGYSDADQGTNWGVTRRWNKTYLKGIGIHSKKDMRKLTQKQAIDFYIAKYWPQGNLDQYEGNPGFQKAAFGLFIQKGINPSTKRMVENAKGDPEKLLQAHAASLRRSKTNGRQHRMHIMKEMVQETCARPTTASLDAAEVLLQEKKQVAFTFHYARQQQSLAQALDKVDKLANEQKTAGLKDNAVGALLNPQTEPKVYTQEIAASFRKGSPEVPVEKTWKERMHALYAQNLDDSTKKREAPIVRSTSTPQYA